MTSGKDFSEKETRGAARVIKNSLFMLLARVIQIAASSFILIAVARYLTVQSYGDYSFIVAFVSSVMALTYFGIQQIMIREISRDKTNAHKYLGSAILLRTCLSLIAAVILMIAIMFIKPSNLIISAILIAIISEFFLTFSMLMKVVFQAFEKMIYEPILTVIYLLILSFAIAAVIHFDMGLLWLLIATAAANAVQFLFAAYIVSSRFVRPSFSIDKNVFWSLFKNSSVIGLGIFFYQNIFRIDVLMLKWLGSAEDIAFFQAPHGLIMQVEILPAALISALFPVFSRVLHSEPERVPIVFEKCFRYIFIFSLITALNLSLFSGEIIGMVFGSKYSRSFTAFSIVSWSIIPISMVMLFDSILIVMNKQRYNVICGGLTLAINFSAAYLLVPIYGFIAAAYISLASYLLLFFFSLYFVVKSGLPIVLNKILGNVTLAVFISGAAILLIKPVSILGAISAGLISYAVTLFMRGAFPMEDISLLKGLIKQFGESRRRV